MMKLMWIMKQAYQIQEDIPSYRVGQHFCSVMGLDSNSDPEINELYMTTDDKRADEIIFSLMERYQWKENHMPVVKTCVYLGNSQWELKDAT